MESGSPQNMESASESSLQSGSSTSSSATHGDPGNLSAKALVAVGEHVLKGVELIYLHAKLLKLQSRFQTFEDKPTPGLDRMFADVLELTRVGYYGPRLRKKALRILLNQLSCGKTRLFVKYLSEWPYKEISLFLQELILCMPYEWTDLGLPRHKIHLELRLFYVQIHDARSPRPSKPLLLFLSRLVSDSGRGRRAFIAVKGLDLLLRLYCRGKLLRFGCGPSGICARNALPSTWTNCLKLLARYPEAANHPIFTLFPHKVTAALDDAIRLRCHARRAVWRRVNLSHVRLRLTSWYKIVRVIDKLHNTYLWDSNGPSTSMFDFYLDLLEFLRFKIYGIEVARGSLDVLLRLLDYPPQSTSGRPHLGPATVAPQDNPDREHLPSERSPFPFRVGEHTYDQIIDGLYSIVGQLRSVIIEEELPAWTTLDYPYHLKPPPSPHAPLVPQGPTFTARFRRAREAATILSIPLAIIREELACRTPVCGTPISMPTDNSTEAGMNTTTGIRSDFLTDTPTDTRLDTLINAPPLNPTPVNTNTNTFAPATTCRTTLPPPSVRPRPSTRVRRNRSSVSTCHVRAATVSPPPDPERAFPQVGTAAVLPSFFMENGSGPGVEIVTEYSPQGSMAHLFLTIFLVVLIVFTGGDPYVCA